MTDQPTTYPTAISNRRETVNIQQVEQHMRDAAMFLNRELNDDVEQTEPALILSTLYGVISSLEAAIAELETA
jgi:hypothetical protein